MFTLRVLVLGAAYLTLIAAHPHNHRSYHTGECMEMRTSARTGRTQWITHPFKCMKDIKLPIEERQAKQICGRKAHDYMLSFFKGDKIDNLKYKNLEEVKTKRHEFFARCMVDRLDLEASDGSLDAGKVIQNSLKMDSSDVSALMKMQTIINICATNSTGENATEQFLLLRNCVRQLVQEHCTLHQQLLRSYLERGRDASVACANVSTDHQNLLLEELFDTCMSEHAVKSASGTKELSVLASSNKGRFAQTMVSSKICVAEKMNWFSQETGFNGQLYRDFVSNFTWEFAPEGRKELLRAMEECDSELEGGSAYNQVHQWESCLAPRVVEICGFNNNITKFFFPFINADIQKAALEYIENLTDDADDQEEEELDDYEDDFTYDDEYDSQMDNNDDTEDDNEDDYDNDYNKTYEEDSVGGEDDGEAETVDDGLLEMNLKPTRTETVKDAMLVDDDADALMEIEELKNKESLEDDAEEFMAHLKKKQVNSPDAKQPSTEQSPKPPSTEVSEAEDLVAPTTEVSVTPLSSTQAPPEGGNDFEGDLSVEETVSP